MIDEGNPRASAADAVRQGLSEAAKATQQATSDIGKDLGEDLRQTRDRVMEQAESAKQGLAGQVKDTADALNAAVIKGVKDVAAENGWDVTVTDTNGDVNKANAAMVTFSTTTSSSVPPSTQRILIPPFLVSRIWQLEMRTFSNPP